MNIVGHQKTSFVDYPDKICSVIFVAGCNFRCPYCHNGHIVENQEESIEHQDILNYLIKRRKFLDGVCISGGEPTMYDDLEKFISIIKQEGFMVKLDTNGTNPSVVEKLLDENLLDYVAMDIKAPLNKYNLLTSTEVDIEAIKRSIDLIKTSNIDYEFRTTMCKGLLTKEDILDIVELIGGSKRYYLQNFRDRDTVLNGKGTIYSYEEATLIELVNEISHKFEICKLR